VLGPRCLKDCMFCDVGAVIYWFNDFSRYYPNQCHNN